MPWITVTTAAELSQDAAASLARDVAAAAADAAGLDPHDVIVLVQRALASWGDGVVVSVSGRRRAQDIEAAIEGEVRRVVVDVTGIDGELVSVVRS